MTLMIELKYTRLFLSLLIHLSFLSVNAQTENVLTLSAAVRTGLMNYQSIHAKRNYYNASSALLKNTKNEYLPNLIASVQQEF